MILYVFTLRTLAIGCPLDTGHPYAAYKNRFG